MCLMASKLRLLVNTTVNIFDNVIVPVNGICEVRFISVLVVFVIVSARVKLPVIIRLQLRVFVSEAVNVNDAVLV